MFNNLREDREWTATDHRLADMMSSYWVNFAATGDPNGEGLPHWPVFEGGGTNTVMALDDESAASSILNRGQMAVFQDYYDNLYR